MLLTTDKSVKCCTLLYTLASPVEITEYNIYVLCGGNLDLKGQCHEIFCFRFFSWIIFPQATENNIRVISIFFKNSRIYSQVKVHHGCQRHRWQISAGINDTGGKFATGINDTSGKFCHQFPLCCWHRWQIMGTISGCRHFEVNLKAKMYIYCMLTLLPKGAQTKLLIFFCLQIFYICHRCRWHRWCTLSRE